MEELFKAVGGDLLTGMFNKRQSDKQMRFQDVSSRTQYQRAVADMKKAGINPMLAAKLGGNAAMQGSSSTMPDLGKTINTSRQVSNQKKLIEAQIKLMQNQADEASAKAAYARSQSSEVVSKQQSSYWDAMSQNLFSGGEKNISQAQQAQAEINRINETARKIAAEIKGIEADTFIKELSFAEKKAMQNVYEMMNGNVGEVQAFLEAFAKAGIRLDGIAGAMGLTSLVRKYSKRKKTKHTLTRTPRRQVESYEWEE